MSKALHSGAIRAMHRIVTVLQANLETEIAAVKASYDTDGITEGIAALAIKTPLAAAYHTIYSDSTIPDYLRNFDPAVLVWLNSDEELSDYRSGSPSTIGATQEFELVVMVVFRLAAFTPFTYNAKPVTIEEAQLLAASVYNGAVMQAVLKKACGTDDVLDVLSAGQTREFLADDDARPIEIRAATKWTIRQDVQIPQPQ